MDVWEIFIYICLWHIVGFVTWLVLGGCFNVQVIEYSSGIEFVNPLVIYKQTRVNWFGAFFPCYTLWNDVSHLYGWILAL